MAKITTVRGDIDPQQLGVTSMHEHTICNMNVFANIAKRMQSIEIGEDEEMPVDAKERKEDLNHWIGELQAFKKCGGNAICDASPHGMRGNISDIREASEVTDVHIICATGLYIAASRSKKLLEKSESDMVELFKQEIHEGIDGTNIKAGFVKCALGAVSDSNTLEENELRSLRACAEVAVDTGMSIQIHTGKPMNAKHVMQTAEIIVKEYGIKPEKVVMCHMDSWMLADLNTVEYVLDFEKDRKLNLDMQLELLDMGVNIGFDSWGLPFEMPMTIKMDDYDRLKGLMYFINKGYEAQIVLGHDAVGRSCGVSSGNYGYTRFPEFALPMLSQLGVGEDVIRKLTIENPERILAY